MKKLLAVLILLALTMSAFAQDNPESKWTVRSSAAYFPSIPYILLPWIGIAEALSADEDAGEEAKIDFPPYISIEGLYWFNNRWAVGANTGYIGMSGKVVRADGTVKNRDSFTLIPLTVVGRCNYVSHPAFKLYGSLEAGAMFAVSDDFEVVPNFQFNPIGTEFGRKFFGLFEIGLGMNYFGIRAGVGYKF